MCSVGYLLYRTGGRTFGGRTDRQADKIICRGRFATNKEGLFGIEINMIILVFKRMNNEYIHILIMYIYSLYRLIFILPRIIGRADG